MNETHRLLREYVDEGSEIAFREIVSRYIDLVYSVALRRVSGDAHRAQDVVQMVFTDLAHKAESLPPNVMLGGWLHRHSCFVASTICRSEMRRLAREKEAVDLMKGNEESSWDDLAPVLDDAIQDLEEPDRNAITLRFFERHDLRTIGGLTGISEDAAQKRVSRALEKLRHLLTTRGVALSAAALAGALEANSLSAAPASWAAQVSSQALSTAPAKLGLLATVAAFFSGTAIKLASVALVAALFGSALYFKKTQEAQQTRSESRSRPEAKQKTLQSVAASNPESEVQQSNEPTAAPAATHNGIRLSIFAAETGKPITNGPVELRGYDDKFFKGNFSSDSQGVCFVDFPRETATQVEITTRIPGYADTRLRWIPKQGETVPQEYTLRLERGIPIGGLVVNDQGEPVFGAKVGFNNHENAARTSQVESHVFSWIETETDNAGRWGIDRIGSDVVRNIYGGASHPEYVGSESVNLNHDSTPFADLRAGTHVFHLGRAVEVRGIVLDQDRNPVAGASVLAGPRDFSGSRETTAALDGTFELRGVKPGTNRLTAQVPQFAPATVEFFAETNSPPIEIILGGGHILKMRIVNKSGEPIKKADIWLDTLPHGPDGESASVQAAYRGKSDADGRIYWDQAPGGKLRFTVFASGYCRQDGLEFEADGSEHTVVLKPALHIFGTVRDGENNNLIPRFKITAGWPSNGPEGKKVPFWSDIEDKTLTFADGKFDYRFEEPVVFGTREWSYIFKVTADNYTTFITRVIEGDEGEANLEIQLKPSRSFRITVLQPNGEPAANTEVLFAGVQQQVHLSDHGFDRTAGGGGGSAITDSEGMFSWQPDDSVAVIYVAGPAGFASTRPAELENNPILPMKTWGRILGSYTKRKQPVVGVGMTLNNLPRHGAWTEPWLHVNSTPTTDAEGHFEFPTVPPIKFQLCYLSPNGDRSFSHVPLQEVQVQAGETTTVNYIEDGIDIVARVTLPAGVTREKGDMLFAFVHSPTPIPPPEIMGNQEALQKWAQNPEIAPQLQNVKSWPMREMPDHTFKAETVPAGEYGVEFNLGRPNNSSAPLSARRSITVTGEEPDATLDLGEVILLSPPVPSLAEAAQALDKTENSGQKLE